MTIDQIKQTLLKLNDLEIKIKRCEEIENISFDDFIKDDKFNIKIPKQPLEETAVIEGFDPNKIIKEPVFKEESKLSFSENGVAFLITGIILLLAGFITLPLTIIYFVQYTALPVVLIIFGFLAFIAYFIKFGHRKEVQEEKLIELEEENDRKNKKYQKDLENYYNLKSKLNDQQNKYHQKFLMELEEYKVALDKAKFKYNEFKNENHKLYLDLLSEFKRLNIELKLPELHSVSIMEIYNVLNDNRAKTLKDAFEIAIKDQKLNNLDPSNYDYKMKEIEDDFKLSQEIHKNSIKDEENKINNEFIGLNERVLKDQQKREKVIADEKARLIKEKALGIKKCHNCRQNAICPFAYTSYSYKCDTFSKK